MRSLQIYLLLVLTVILPLHTSAQSANITFRASLKSPENNILPNVYVKIYGPDNTRAVDSLFSDEAGNIEALLPFSLTGTNSIPAKQATYGIVAPMSPNMISAATPSPIVEYNYPAGAKILFTDVQGKKHPNGSLLPPGLYFYLLEFEDGARSMVHKILLTGECRVNAELRNQYSGYADTEKESRVNAKLRNQYSGYAVTEEGSRVNAETRNRHRGYAVTEEEGRVNAETRNRHRGYAVTGDEGRVNAETHNRHRGYAVTGEEGSLKKSSLENNFYAECIKDGYVTLRDTIYIDTSVIQRTYNMEAVTPPNPAFSHTGEMVTWQPVLFDATASGGAYDEELVYAWDFGDGKRGQSVRIPHIFIAPGNYDVTLTVSGRYGTTQEVTQVVTITAEQVATQFTGSVIGSVTGMDGPDLKDAVITLVGEDRDVLTDQRGMAVMQDLPMGIPLHFRITKAGYVTQVVQLTIPETTGEALFFAALKKRVPAVTFSNVEFGGTKTGVDGAAFTLPVGGLVKKDGSMAKGDIQVNLTPVDVAFDAAAFPGSFVGYRADGEDGVLLSYGVAEFHFEQDGEELQLAAGKKATILIPVYTSGASVGDEIPLWSVDEESGSWVEEGTGIIVASEASPTGLAYRADIGHLSWWNCDDWEDDRKREGLCYRLECAVGVCVVVRIECWMSGAMRNKMKSQSHLKTGSHQQAQAKSLSRHLSQSGEQQQQQQASGEYLQTSLSCTKTAAERDDIPPVFEVRDFIPETGKNLRFPTTRDVLIEARAFGPGNVLYGGLYTVEGSAVSDTFAVELVPLSGGDTIDLELNNLREFYLEQEEILTFRVEIPEAEEYRIYAEPGETPHLQGIFSVFQDGEKLLSEDIGTAEHWVSVHPGTLFVSVAGQLAESQGNFIIGVSERSPMLVGDTLALALNIPAEAFLGPSEYKHFKVEIPSAGMYRVDLKFGSNPSLRGRFEVGGTGAYTYRFLTTDDHGYILAEEGTMILSVAGTDLKKEGNFIIGIWDFNASPLALNDSLFVNMQETEQYHMYSLSSATNTLIDCRFYQAGDLFLSGNVSLISPSGNILGKEDLYTPGARIVFPMTKDSIYYAEVERRGASFDYVMVTEEQASTQVSYGDTLNEKLINKGDKEMYHFDGVAGDVVSIRGFQPDYQLTDGWFSLWNEAGKEIVTRDISYSTTTNDYEIIFEIPETGTYSILVGSYKNDTGSYQLILQKIVPADLALDECTEVDAEDTGTLYASFELSGEKLIHLSILSSSGSGSFHLWDAGGKRLTSFDNNSAIYSFYNASFTRQLPAGKYFIRIDNKSATAFFINLAKARPLSFDEKGKAAFTDTIHQPHFIQAYSFSGKAGDGVHGILKKVDGETVPDDPELMYFRMTEPGGPLAPDYKSGKYYGLDDNYLYESAMQLEGEFEDTVFVLVVYGKTEGTVEVTFHRVAAAETITVDDDFAEYPEAQTSSHIAAGYAVKEPGSVTLANGTYSSMLSMMIESGFVTLSGQDTENVLLRNTYNRTNNPVVCLYSESGRITELSLSCGISNYYAIDYKFDGVTLDNIHILPLEGDTKVAGGIKGSGNNLTLNNITMTNSTRGIDITSSGAVVENCDLQTENFAIAVSGEDIVIRNNTIEVTFSNRAINTRAWNARSGSQIIEGNTIRMTKEGYVDGNGIFNIENSTGPTYNTATVIRNNTIHSVGNNAAFYLTVGNPPSTITVENNSYYGTGTGGGKALMLQTGRNDGSSSIIVRNNTFSGMRSESSIIIYGAEYIASDRRFTIVNNSFRFSPDAQTGAGYSFVEAQTAGVFSDTASLYLVNNIFQGNGTTLLMKCNHDFSLVADYNTVYGFSNYLEGPGSIIGTGHDITDDPLFLDDDLQIDATSPAVDKGADAALFPGIPVFDKNGVARPQGSGYDMGAYEQ